MEELIDELLEVEDKSKEVIYWNSGSCGVDKVDEDEISVQLR